MAYLIKEVEIVPTLNGVLIKECSIESEGGGRSTHGWNEFYFDEYKDFNEYMEKRFSKHF